jgi:hypothetical protein
MAAGVVIKHKRKSGAFIDGDLAAGEWGLDVSGDAWYYSKNGTTVELHASGGNLSNFGSPTSGQYARFTDATHAEGVSVASVKTDLSLNNVTNESKATMFTDAALTGNPTAPTQSAGNSSTRIASTAFVSGEIASANLGIQKRTTVRAATTANITISTALNNGDSAGRRNARDKRPGPGQEPESSPEENGVYVVGVSPARSAQYDTYDEHAGAIIVIEEGTSNADTIYFSTSNLGGTLDTTAISLRNLSSPASCWRRITCRTLRTLGRPEAISAQTTPRT